MPAPPSFADFGFNNGYSTPTADFRGDTRALAATPAPMSWNDYSQATLARSSSLPQGLSAMGMSPYSATMQRYDAYAAPATPTAFGYGQSYDASFATTPYTSNFDYGSNYDFNAYSQFSTAWQNEAEPSSSGFDYYATSGYGGYADASARPSYGYDAGYDRKYEYDPNARATPTAAAWNSAYEAPAPQQQPKLRPPPPTGGPETRQRAEYARATPSPAPQQQQYAPRPESRRDAPISPNTRSNKPARKDDKSDTRSQDSATSGRLTEFPAGDVWHARRAAPKTAAPAWSAEPKLNTRPAPDRRRRKPFSQETMKKLAGAPRQLRPAAAKPRGTAAVDDDACSVNSVSSRASNWSNYSTNSMSSRGSRGSQKRRNSKSETASVFGAFKAQRPVTTVSQKRSAAAPDASVATMSTVATQLDPVWREPSKPTREDPPLPGVSAAPPADLPSQFTLAESLMIMFGKYGDLQGHTVRSKEMVFSLSAAILMDLFLRKRIEPHPNTVRTPDKLEIRILNESPVGDEYLDVALSRMIQDKYKQKTLAYWVWAIASKLGQTKMLQTYGNKFTAKGLFTSPKPNEYVLADEAAFFEVNNIVEQMKQIRKQNQESPVRGAVLGVLFWLPKDSVTGCFGKSLEAYTAKQMCRSITYAVQKLVKPEQ